MDSITALTIRSVLASNLRDFASRASHCSHNPRQIEIRSLEKHAAQCTANANFCFQINAIDGDSYSKIRDLINDGLNGLRLLRKVYNAKNYICGQDRATEDAKAALVRQVNRLRDAINFITDEAKTERTYHVAVVRESGEWDIIDTFTAADDDSANAYAEQNHDGIEWYVLDDNRRNING